MLAGQAHVDSATLSDQTAGRKPRKPRPSRGERRASKRNRGTRYPGPKKADSGTLIERLSWQALRPEQFYFSFQVQNLPAVLDGPLPDSWGALQKLTKRVGKECIPDIDAIVGMAGADTMVPVDVGARDGVSSGQETVRRQMALRDFAAWWKSRDCASDTVFYLKDWHMARDLGMSGVLYEPILHFAEEHDWLNGWWDRVNAERLRGESSGRLDDYRFVYIGCEGSWTPLHHDVLASYSWSCNLCGVKRWLLFPPEVTPLLYDKLGLNLATDARAGSADDRDPSRFPGLAKARESMITVVQTAGETMFVPSGWHHQVHNVADCLSVK